MSDAGARRIDTILENLTCPQCRYSLRGLVGEIVTCPECGHRVNLNAYVAAQWRGPWFRAPLYNMLAYPLAWATMMTIGTMLFAANAARDAVPMALLAGAVVLVMGWIAILRLVVMRFGSPEGLWLALLVHCTVPFYLGGFILFISGTVTLLSGRRMMWWHLTYGAGLMIGGVMAVIAAFLIERFVAHRCIRRHLRVAAMSAVEPEQ